MPNQMNQQQQMNPQSSGQLTHLELENLRHLIGGHATVTNKLEQYAQACQDPQLKQMLQRDAQQSRTTQQRLMGFLQ